MYLFEEICYNFRTYSSQKSENFSPKNISAWLIKMWRQWCTFRNPNYLNLLKIVLATPDSVKTVCIFMPKEEKSCFLLLGWLCTVEKVSEGGKTVWIKFRAWMVNCSLHNKNVFHKAEDSSPRGCVFKSWPCWRN